MEHPFNTALNDLIEAIRNITLGSVEHGVIEASGYGLIRNWNDHNSHAPIDETAELEAWASRAWEDLQKN